MSNPADPGTVVPAKEEHDGAGGVAVVRGLPVSIISDILSRLPMEDIARCKCVRKSWYNLSKHPHFTHSHYLTGSASSQQHNILLWETSDFAFLDPINISALYLISNGNGEKRNTINISSDAVYFESYDSVDKKYKVALAYKRKCYIDDTRRRFTLKMTANIITFGETSWRVLQFPDDLETNILNREPLFIKGAFHWVIGKRFHEEYFGKDETQVDGMLSLDITTENFQIINFSKSLKIPDSYLEQIQLENSPAFARVNDIKNDSSCGPPTVEIWQIQGANPDGSCLYKKWKFNVHVEGCTFGHDLKGFKLLGAFDNDVFLFKAYLPRTRDEPSLRNHLVLFDPEKDEGSVLKITGAPKSFNASVFSPSFISPTL